MIQKYAFLFRKFGGLFLLALISSSHTACSKLGDQTLLGGGLGAVVTVVSGNRQSCVPNQLCEKPLRVRVISIIDGKPIPYIGVRFSSLSGAIILNSYLQTDQDGYSETQVKSPNRPNSTFEVISEVVGSITENAKFYLNTTASQGDEGSGSGSSGESSGSGSSGESSGSGSSGSTGSSGSGSSGSTGSSSSGSSGSTGSGSSSGAAGPPTKFFVDTDHGSIEKAGVPFKLKVELRDKNNRTSSFAGTVDLFINIWTNPSWGGVLPTIPLTKFKCEFKGGVCEIDAPFILSDSLIPSYVSLGDGPTGYDDVFMKPLKVNPSEPHHLVIATAPGGPTLPLSDASGSSVTCSWYDPNLRNTYKTYSFGALSVGYAHDSVNSSDRSFYPLVVDDQGNYLRDAVDVVWSGDLNYLSDHLTTSPEKVVLTPTQSGRGGKLLAALPDSPEISPGSIPFDLAPGDPTSFKVETENLNTEVSGIPFSIRIEARDQKNNLVDWGWSISDGYFGNILVTFALQGAASAPRVSGGCGRIYLRDYWMNSKYDTDGACDQTFDFNVQFLNGVADTGSAGIYSVLNDATSVAPVLTVSVPATADFATLTGSVAVSVNIGAPFRIVPHLSLGDNGDQICSYETLDKYATYSSDVYACIKRTAGDPAETWYAAVEDRGGNFIENKEVVWNPGSIYINDWSPTGSTASSVFTPKRLGSGQMILTDGSVTTVLNGVTSYSVLDHYEVSAYDGLNSMNTLSVLRDYELKIVAKDKENNTIPMNEAANLNIVYQGVNPSPAGNRAAIPPSGIQSYFFVNGEVKIPLLRLRNVTDRVRIQVDDGVHFSNVLVPGLMPGGLERIQIRTAANNAGDDITGKNFSIGFGQAPTYYLAQFDSEMNYIFGNPEADWSGTLQDYATMNFKGSSTTITPNKVGGGNVEVRYSGLTAATGMITILPPGKEGYYSVRLSRSEITAGVPFGFIVELRDVEGFPVTNVSETRRLTWDVDSWQSWGGYDPVLPQGEMTCVFDRGECHTGEVYQVFDSRRKSFFSVAGNLPGTVNSPIDVKPAKKHHVVISDLPGGPRGLDGDPTTFLDNASWFDSSTPNRFWHYWLGSGNVGYAKDIAGSVPRNLYASVVDEYGNYIEEVTATWTADAPYLSAALSGSVGKSVTLTPTLSGVNGQVTVTSSEAGILPARVPLNISPGDPHHLKVVTEHLNTELPGQQFSVEVLVLDSQQNVVDWAWTQPDGYTGVFPVKFQLTGQSTSPLVSGGCGRFFMKNYWDNFLYQTGSDCDLSSFDYPLSFVRGRVNTGSMGVYAVLNDATDVNPVLTGSITPASGGTLLTGTVPISISRGVAHRIVPHQTLGNQGDQACNAYQLSQDGSASVFCMTRVAGDPAGTWYAALEDQGGNFIENKAVTWTPEGSFVLDWAPTGLTNSSLFTPLHLGRGVMLLDDGTGLSTRFNGMIQDTGLDHFELSVSDGTNPINRISVLKSHSLKISAKDKHGNTVPLTKNIDLKIDYLGASRSPALHDPIVPSSGYSSYSFKNGEVTVSGFKLPNASNSVSIEVTDGIHRSNSLIPSLIPGELNEIQIRTQPNNSGINLNNESISIQAGASPPPVYYLASYDVELNYLGGNPIGTWSGAITDYATITESGSYTTVQATTITAPTDLAVLEVSYSGKTASTGTITVYPGDDDYILVNTTRNNITAGTTFGFVIQAYDRFGNPSLLTGDYNLTWTVDSWLSWTGEAPNLPSGSLNCTFDQGKCETLNSYFASDSRRKTKFSVAFDDLSVKGVSNQEIKINYGLKKRLLITTGSGGPNENVSWYDSSVPNTFRLYSIGNPQVGTAQDVTTSSSRRLYAALVDSKGNYISSASTSSTWSVSQPYLTLGNTSGASTTLNFLKSGQGGKITVSSSGVESGVIEYSVAPGPVHHFKVETENKNTEVAGTPFGVTVSALDVKDNLVDWSWSGKPGFTGNYPVTFQLSNNATPPLVSGGCGRFYISNYYMNFLHQTGTSCERTFGPYPISFNQGQARTGISNIYAVLNDATGVSPTLRATTPAVTGEFDSSLTGVATLSVQVGSDYRIIPHQTQGDSGDHICSSEVFDQTTPNSVDCLNKNAGDSPVTYYAAIEDRGGNFKENKSVLWTPSGGAFVNHWDPVGQNISSKFSPQVAGSGMMTLSFGAIVSQFRGTTSIAGLHHFDLAANDGFNSVNTLSAEKDFSLIIIAKDVQNNQVSLMGDVAMSISFKGVNPSPAGNSAVLPPTNKTLRFVNGSATIAGLRLKNASDKVTIEVGDGTHLSNSLAPIIIPGELNSLKIRSAANNAGKNLLLEPTTIPFGVSPPPYYYLAQYDSELNYISDESAAASWSGTITNIALIDSLGSKTAIAPSGVGDGILTVNYKTLSASTAKITVLPGLEANYLVETTHNKIEKAGEPFGFIIKVLDTNGIVVTSVDQVDRTLIWAHDSWSSWGGVASNLPSGSMECRFVQGVCRTAENYTIADSRRETRVTVTGSTTATASIQVRPNSEHHLVIATGPDGPSQNAFWYDPVTPNQYQSHGLGAKLSASALDTADSPNRIFYSSVVDRYGNFIRQGGSSAEWSVDSAYLRDAFDTLRGPSLVFSPTKSGKNGKIKVSEGSITSDWITYSVAPGAPKQLQIDTENNNQETAGKYFSLKVLAIDAKGNLVDWSWNGGVGYTRKAPVTFHLSGIASAPKVSAGCGRFFQFNQWQNFLSETGTACDQDFTYDLDFYNGQTNTGLLGIYAQLNDATDVNPVITATIAAADGNPVLTSNRTITVSQGPAHRIIPHLTAGDHGDFVCDYHIIANNQLCIIKTVGDVAVTYHAAFEDLGGNFLSNPTTDWTPQDAYVSAWTPFSSTSSSTFTPKIGGEATLKLTSGSITTTLRGKNQDASLHHFVVSVNDGINTTNTISVLQNYILTIEARDSNNNLLRINESLPLKISYHGANPSPKGTHPIVPDSTQTSRLFTQGVVILSGLRLVNALDSVVIEVTDGTHSSNSLKPVLITGPLDYLRIRTGLNNTGVDYTGVSFQIPSGDAPTPLFYLAQYDSEGNFIQSNASATWSGTIISLATITPLAGPATSLVPRTAGKGILKVDYAGKEASTGEIEIKSGNESYYTVQTTGGGTEAAGENFGFIVKVHDANGNEVLSANGSRPLNWSFDSWKSWTGTSPVLPLGVQLCEFKNGICETEKIYRLADSRRKTLFSVGDGRLSGVTNQEITVRSGAKSRLLIVNHRGGPNGLDGDFSHVGDNASWYTGTNTLCQDSIGDRICTATSLSAISSAKIFYAAAIDSNGNFVEDVTDVSWTGSEPYLSTALSNALGVATITPQKSGKGGRLEVASSTSALTSGSVQLDIAPGPVTQILLNTENSNVETAGNKFKVRLEAVDAYRNVVSWSHDGSEGFSGVVPLTFSITGSATPPKVSGGCGRFMVLPDATVQDWSTFSYKTGSDCDQSFPTTLFFNKGVALTSLANIYAVLNDATSVTPKIKVVTQAFGGFGSFSGESPSITVTTGSPSRLVPHLSAGPSSEPACDDATLSQYLSKDKVCITQIAGDPPKTYYAVLEDAGGNYLNDVDVTWIPQGSYVADWSPTVTTSSSTLTPKHAGDGYMTLKSGSIETTWRGLTKNADLHHFLISVDDQENSINTVSVLKPYELRVEARDSQDNLIPLNQKISLRFTYTGASSSLKGSSPILPSAADQEYSFINGQTVLSGLRLYNANSSVTIQAADIHSHLSNSLVPVLKPGPPTELKIRSAPNNGGTDHTNQTISLNSSQTPTPTYYLALYDQELNYIQGNPAATWGGTIQSIATLNTSGHSTQVIPVTTGSGKLTASYGSLPSVSTGTITISSGSESYYSAKTTHDNAEVAGIPFGFIVELRDDAGNIVPFTGSRTLTWSYDSWKSWTGSEPSLPSGGLACSFDQGVCRTAEIYKIFDSRRSTLFSVSGSGLTGVLNQAINVGPGPAHRVLISNKKGGPNGEDGDASQVADNAWWYSNDNSLCFDSVGPRSCGYDYLYASSPAQTLYAAVVDSNGNFIRNATEATWSADQVYVTQSLSRTSGESIVFTPNQSGNDGHLTVAVSGLLSSTRSVTVAPGTPSSVRVVTQNGGTEVPGAGFSLALQALDSKGNIVSWGYSGLGYTGNFSVTFSITGSDSSPIVSSGCARFYSDWYWDNFRLETGSQCNRSFTYALDFMRGEVSSISKGIYAVLNDATGVSPVISATVGSAHGFGSLTGSTGVIGINVGADQRIMPYTALGDSGTFVCNYLTQSHHSYDGYRCLYNTVGDAPVTYYAAVEDGGGNFKRNEAVNWVTYWNYIGEWLPNQASISSVFTPTHRGGGFVDLTNSSGTIATRIRGENSNSALHHFEVGGFDGINPKNNISALSAYRLEIIAKDHLNNTVPYSQDLYLTITTTGATASPKGTPPVLPQGGKRAYTFVNGIAYIDNLRLPNSANTVKITVADDSSHNGTLVPTILPGALTLLDIRDGAAGAGQSVKDQALTLKSGVTPTPVYYVAQYDAEGNYINGDASGAIWSGMTDLSPGGISVIVNTDRVRSGTLQVSLNSVTSKTGLVHVVPGDQYVYVAKTTTSSNMVNVGQRFGFIVEVQDIKGNIVSTVNETRSLVWNVDSWDSWTGSEPEIPNGPVPCVFASGVCSTATDYFVTDARRSTRFSVGDGTTILGVSNQEIKVIKGAKTRLLFANQSGGPNGADNNPMTSTDNAWWYDSAKSNWICFSPGGSNNCKMDKVRATSPVQSYYVVAVDTYGNYIEDANTVTWSKTGSYLGSTVTTFQNRAILTPQQSGRGGTLGVSSSDLPPTTLNLDVAPGEVQRFEVKTEHNNTEIAGEPFSFLIQALDQKGNVVDWDYEGATGGYSGPFNLTFSLNGVSSAPRVSGGCARMFLTDYFKNFRMGTDTDCNNDFNFTLSFYQGTLDTGASGVYAVMNDATLNTPPQILVTASASGVFPALSGTNSVAIQQGPEFRILPYTQLGNTGTFVCDYKTQAYVDPTSSVIDYCINKRAGEASIQYYAAIEDRGGNFIRNAPVNWSPQGNYSPDWSPTNATQVSTFTPIHAGEGSLNLSLGSISTTIKGMTQYQSLDHYELSVSDGVNTLNNISVLNPYTLYIKAVDIYGNQLPERKTLTDLRISYIFDNPSNLSSPKGTSAVLPTGTQTISGNTIEMSGMTLQMVNGEIALGGLRLPNLNNGVRIQVRDASSKSSTLLSPNLLAGPVDRVWICSSSSCSGTNITDQIVSPTTDETPIYYLGAFDSEDNPITNTTSASWSTHLNSLGTMSSSSGSWVSFTPSIPSNTSPGPKTLSVTYAAKTATITVNVLPGALDHFDVVTSHHNSEMAGVPFTTTVTMKDKKNNTRTNDSGSYFLTVSVVNGVNSRWNFGEIIKPQSGNYTFNQGILSLDQDYTLVNSENPPTIIYSTTVSGKTVLGQAPVTLKNNSLDFFWVAVDSSSFVAGNMLTWTIAAMDSYGNIISEGPGATAEIQATLSSNTQNSTSEGGVLDISSTSGMSSVSSVSGSADTWVTGKLGSSTPGVGKITVKATGSGSLTLNVIPYGSGPSLKNDGSTPDRSDFGFYNDIHPSVLPVDEIHYLEWKTTASPASSYTASNTTPMRAFTVQFKDIYNNLIYTGSKSTSQVVLDLMMGTGNLTTTTGAGGLTLSGVGGEATYANILYPRAESIILRAKTGTSPNQKTLTQSITVNVGSPSQAIVYFPSHQSFTAGVATLEQAVTGAVPQKTAGDPLTARILAVDDGFNLVSAYSQLVRLTYGDPQVTTGSYESFSGGQKDFSFMAKSSGTWSVTPDTGLGSNRSSSTYTVIPNSLNRLAFRGSSSTTASTTLTAGQCIAYQIESRDAYNNAQLISPSVASTITLTSTGGGFYSNSTCTTSISSTTIPAGHAKTADFWFKHTSSGPVTLTSSTAGVPNPGTLAVTIQNAPAASIVFTTHPSANGTAGVLFTSQPVIVIRDSYSNLVTTGTDSSALITLSMSGGSGSLLGTLAVSATGGVATFSGIYGTWVGTRTITATLGSLSVSSSTQPNLVAGSASTAYSSISATGSGVLKADHSDSSTVTITLRDAYNNPIVGVVPQFSVTGSSNTSTPCSASSGEGVSTCTLKTTKAETKTLTVTSPSITAGSLSTTVTFIHGPATQLALMSPLSTVTAGATFSAEIAIQDAQGNTVTTGSSATATVTLSLASGLGTLGGTLTQTASAGVARFNNLSITTSGLKSLQFTSSPLPSINASLTINNASLYFITVTTQPPTTGTAGAAFTTQPKFTLWDVYNNIVTTGADATANVSLSFGTGTTGSGTLSGSTSMNAVAGVADFSGKNISINLVGNYSIQATAGSKTVTTNAISISHGAASQLLFHLQPPNSVPAGTSFSAGVTIQDAQGNTVTTGSSATATVTLSLVSGTGTLAGTLTKTASAGLVSFSDLSITASGSKSLRATSSSLTKDSNSFSVSALSPMNTYSTITGTGPVLADGVESSIVTVTLKDTYQNPVGGVTPTFSASGTGNTIGSCLATNPSGQSTCSLKSTIGETKNLNLLTPITISGGPVIFTAIKFTDSFALSDSFGTQTTNVTHSYKVKNFGTASIPLTTTLSTSTASAWGFGTNNCSSPLSAGAECTLQLIFKAGETSVPLGNYNATLTISAGSAGSLTRTLSGAKQ